MAEDAVVEMLKKKAGSTDDYLVAFARLGCHRDSGFDENEPRSKAGRPSPGGGRELRSPKWGDHRGEVRGWRANAGHIQTEGMAHCKPRKLSD